MSNYKIVRNSNQTWYAIEAEASVGAVGDEINVRRRVAPWESREGTEVINTLFHLKWLRLQRVKGASYRSPKSV